MLLISLLTLANGVAPAFTLAPCSPYSFCCDIVLDVSRGKKNRQQSGDAAASNDSIHVHAPTTY